MKRTVGQALRSALPRDLVLQIDHWRFPDRYLDAHSPSRAVSLVGYDALDCVFVHVPKTGGVSVCNALFGGHGFGHKTVAELKQVLGPLEYRRRYSFTFVRNPYSRLVSAYTFLKGGGITERNRRFARERLAEVDSFESFVLDWLTPETMGEAQHFQPQSHFVCDRGRVGVDFVGRLETFDRDFATVCRRLRVPHTIPGHHNPTSRARRARSYYTPDIAARVSDLYAIDFETFEYDPGALCV